MQIETERLLIRSFTEDDLNDMHEYCAQAEVSTNTGWAAHTSLAESALFLSMWMKEGYRHAIVFKETGKVIGHIAIYPDSEENREDTCELGFALNRQYHRRGIMSEAVTAVLQYLFERMNKEYVWACCFQSNTSSSGLIRKCGFRYMGTGTYYSASLRTEFPSFEYRISKEEWTNKNLE